MKPCRAGRDATFQLMIFIGKAVWWDERKRDLEGRQNELER